MEQQENTPTLLNHALKWAIINGALGIVIFVILYVIDYSLMVNWRFALVGLAIGLTVVIYGGIEYRKSVGGFLSFGKAWQHGFLVFAIAGIVSLIFMAVLYYVIDPELPGKLTEVSLENQREMMGNFGMPPEQVDAEVEKARERTENQFKIGGMGLGYLIQLVIYSILALITGLFVRKNPPVDQM